MKTLSLLLISGLWLNIMAGTSFINSNSKLTDLSGETIASLTKGTLVEVLENKNSMTKVAIKGWSYEIEPNTEIFYDMGITVVLADVDEKALIKRKVFQTKEDEYEEPWIETKIEGWVKSNILTKNFKNLWKKEANFATERCGACHSEPKPENYTAVQFPSLINSMKETAGMSDEEEAFVVNYFQKNKIYGKMKK